MSESASHTVLFWYFYSDNCFLMENQCKLWTART